MKYNYLISYAFTSDWSQGVGNSFCMRAQKISTSEDIKEVEESVKKELHADKVNWLSFSRLDSIENFDSADFSFE